MSNYPTIGRIHEMKQPHLLQSCLVNSAELVFSNTFQIDLQTKTAPFELKANELIEAIELDIQGQVNCHFLFLFPMSSIQTLWRHHSSHSNPSEKERIDFLAELSNLIAGNVKKNLSDTLNYELQLSIPNFVTRQELDAYLKGFDYRSIEFASQDIHFYLLTKETTTERRGAMRFLIVDDAQFMRNMIKKTLMTFGYDNFMEASDGDEAIAITLEEQFDMILMDWNMPTPGIKAVKAIRQNGIKTPILMVTTEGEKIRVIQAIQAGANNYLVKPFTPDQLKDKIAQIKTP